MIYVWSLETAKPMPLTEYQEHSIPADGHCVSSSLPPHEIAKAWCDYWNGNRRFGRTVRYTPLPPEVVVTPCLFDRYGGDQDEFKLYGRAGVDNTDTESLTEKNTRETSRQVPRK